MFLLTLLAAAPFGCARRAPAPGAARAKPPTPTPVPSPDARTPLEVARPVAGRVMRYKYHAWHYPQGVTFLGLLDLAEATGDSASRAYVAGQIENFHATRALWGEPADSDPGYGVRTTPPGFRPATAAEAERLGICPWCCPVDDESDACRLWVKVEGDRTIVRLRPGHDRRIQNGIWLELYRQTQDAKFLDWQRAAMAKVAAGRSSFAKRPEFSKIIDASFLPGTALARMGALTGETQYFDAAVDRMVAFTELLRDPATGLFHQGWGFPNPDPDGYTPGYWGRGNGWIIAALVETLAFLPKEHPGYERVLTIFKEHCAAMAQHQDEHGMWHQLVDRPDSYPETSVSGLTIFAYAKGARLGFLDREYAERARRGFAGLKRYVRPDGTVLNTCTGTGPAKISCLNDYYTRPYPPNDPHGDGPVLLAAAEIIRLDQAAAQPSAASPSPKPSAKGE